MSTLQSVQDAVDTLSRTRRLDPAFDDVLSVVLRISKTSTEPSANRSLAVIALGALGRRLLVGLLPAEMRKYTGPSMFHDLILSDLLKAAELADEVLGAISLVLREGAGALQADALKALREWGNITQLEQTVQEYAQSKSENVEVRAYHGASGVLSALPQTLPSLLKLCRQNANPELGQLARETLTQLGDDQSLEHIRAMYHQPTAWINLYGYMEEEFKECRARVDAALTKLREAAASLDRPSCERCGSVALTAKEFASACGEAGLLIVNGNLVGARDGKDAERSVLYRELEAKQGFQCRQCSRKYCMKCIMESAPAHRNGGKACFECGNSYQPL